MTVRPQPIATLFRASGAAAVIVALANVATLVATVDVACVRDVEMFFAILGPPGEPRTELTGRFFAWVLPTMLRWPFELRVPSTLLIFTALSIAATLAIFWAAAAFLALLMMLTRRLVRTRMSDHFTRWVSAAAYPLALLVGFAFPAILGITHDVLRGAGGAVISAVAAAIALLLWAALLWGLRQRGAVLFVRGCFLVSLTVMMLAWSGALVSVALGHRRVQPAAAPGDPNILLVSIDSLRSDHVHSYGYPRATSPTIDTLAREGTSFRTVMSPTSWTLPAHLTLLTALSPEEHGVVADGERMRKDALFLTEVLWRAGYATAGFVSAPYLDAVYGFSQGFDHYDDFTIAQISHEASEQAITSPTLLRIFSEWLDQWNADGRQRPFFIFLHMWDVHYDYAPPPPYDSMFDPDYHGTVTGKNYEFGTQVHPGMDPRDLQHIIALYDGEIRYTDEYLGRVLDRLRTLGILDDTVVVVTADHGDEFFEHGRKGHKKALYDESLLVPLVMRFPKKVPAAKVVEPQVRLMDVAPTILSLAGIPRPPGFGSAITDGSNAPHDLTAWMMNDPRTLPLLPAFSDLVGDAPVRLAAVRTPAFKFIKELADHGKEELYDLSADAGEHANLISRDRSADTPLRQDLASWRDTWLGRSHAEKVALSEAHKQRLRSLGYVQ